MQKFMTALFICFVLAFSSQVSAQETKSVSDESKAELQLALERGQKIYSYDQAAWHGTDAMREDIKDLANSGIRGWVVTPEEKGLRIIFYSGQNGEGGAVYSALWTGSSKMQERHAFNDDEERSLTEEQLRLIAAKQAAIGEKFERCSNSPFNSVVLPRKNPTDVDLVYFLTPQTKNNEYPFGGHYRFAVKDGKVAEMRKFANSCISLNNEGKEGQAAVALSISHLLDPIPTEVHVFSTYAIGLPLYVITIDNKFVWSVEIKGGEPEVRIVDQLDDK